jgi:pimeloyl-ACP methyl ester carboxylesterase
MLGSWPDAAAYVRDINQSAFPENSEEEWDKWARRLFAETAPGQLALRYDPNIAIAIRDGNIKPSSMLARFAFRRLARRRPTLLIRGALSDLIEQKQAQLMRAAAPKMEYVEVAGVGHAPMLMETEAQAALREFLGRVD